MKSHTQINQESLLRNYLPADYLDSFARDIYDRPEITPDELLQTVFSSYPWWVDMLLKLRNVLVKPLGLKGGDFSAQLEKMVLERNVSEVIIGMDDKHLAFYVSLWCDLKKGSSQHISVTTVVRYNNGLGKLYFTVIRPFHKVILKNLINKGI